MIARGVAPLNPWADTVMAEYDSRGRRIAELEATLSDVRKMWDVSIAQTGDALELVAEREELARMWRQRAIEVDQRRRELEAALQDLEQ